MMALKWGFPPPVAEVTMAEKCGRSKGGVKVMNRNNGGCDGAGGFPSFLPQEVEKIKDPFARILAQRIERLPVQIGFSESCIMSSCVKPRIQSKTTPVLLLHCFDSSCLEWRCAYPLLEEAGLEAWAVDVLGWGFSDLERLPRCDAVSKRFHLYQLWKAYIRKPMILVGPSLGAAVAIDFAVNYPEAVQKLVLINPSVYAQGTGHLSKLPKPVAYVGVSLLKTYPLRLFANNLTFKGIPLSKRLDWTNVGRLHCHLPWWKDATVDFMISGGYNVVSQIGQVKQKALIIYGEQDQIVSNQLAVRLYNELQTAIMWEIPDCGHLAHVEKPKSVAKLIADFARGDI
ncbi:Abhydrolase_6 domain-containing protein [Cephalotus follicularis]|uniref:Abhydrolase_6 domain-containing protein n=1 Tax=Cephalotus follicularis TaxID=3775 RepID=A0A1Q3BCP7_CEPFO|nr:Abhydrolase_6 domain-containing protein [Cephalotus follicularis]